MIIDLFGFVFQIIGSFLTFWITEAQLDGPITFGGFIVASFVICFVIGKLLGLTTRELDDYEDESYGAIKSEFSSKMSYKPRHSSGPKHSSSYPKDRRYSYIPRHERKG